MMIGNDNDGQIILGDLGGQMLPDICLTGEEKPRENLTQETCPDRGSNPSPLREQSLDQNTKASLPECAVSTMSGPPPEKTQSITQRATRAQSQDRN